VAVSEEDERAEIVENSISGGSTDQHQRRILRQCIAPSTDGPSDDQIFTADAVEFVTALATINVAKGVSMSGQAGGQKDNVTPFLYSYGNKNIGCSYTNSRPNVVERQSLAAHSTATQRGSSPRKQRTIDIAPMRTEVILPEFVDIQAARTSQSGKQGGHTPSISNEHISCSGKTRLPYLYAPEN